MCLFSWSFVLQLTSFCEISAFINGNDQNIGKFFVLLSSSTNASKLVDLDHEKLMSNNWTPSSMVVN
jgi:hypothetical protein